MKDGERFPAEAIRELELQLGRIPFEDESIASATSSFLNPYRTYRGNRSGLSLAKEHGALLLKLIFGPIISVFNISARAHLYRSARAVSGRILVNTMSTKNHYRKIMNSLAVEFRAAELVGIGIQSKNKQTIFSHDRYFEKQKIGMICGFSDQLAIAMAAIGWLRVLVNFRKFYALSWYFVVRSLSCLIQAALKMLAYREFLKHLQPRCVIFDFDRYSGNVPLVCAANSLRILTITLQHGAINRTGWEVIPSRYLLAWGVNSKRRLVDWYDIEHGKVLICGNLMVDDQVHQDRLLAGKYRTPSDDCLIVGLVTNPLSLSERKLFFDSFCMAVEKISLRVILKPHPAEDENLYRGVTRLSERLELRDRDSSIFDLYRQCHVVVVNGSSSVVMEAISAGRPVVAFNPSDIFYPSAAEWKLAGAVLEAHSSEQLSALLLRLQLNEQFYAGRVNAGLAYLGREYASFGKEAARRTHTTIKGLIETNA